ncbi:MAG: hypothetical protein GEV08_18600 [Acidimicrobiia bacterium]|nr:hypothetical protein [Acidimicrobiia bacterium]
MSWFDRVRAALRREAAEVRESWDEATAKADDDLTRRERELAATPEERLDSVQKEIAESEDPFAEVRAKLDAMRKPEPGDSTP